MVKINSGKRFEKEIKDSVDELNKKSNDIYFVRMPDSASGFGMDSSKTRFSQKSIYDNILWHRKGVMVAMEAKSIGGTSISFSLEHDKKEIKASQIRHLEIADSYGVVSGLIINFRKYERTFWVPILELLKFINSTDKKSINVNDIDNLDCLELEFRKLKINCRYNLLPIFNMKGSD